jgi:hypothetical protein
LNQSIMEGTMVSRCFLLALSETIALNTARKRTRSSSWLVSIHSSQHIEVSVPAIHFRGRCKLGSGHLLCLLTTQQPCTILIQMDNAIHGSSLLTSAVAFSILPSVAKAEQKPAHRTIRDAFQRKAGGLQRQWPFCRWPF